MPYDDLIKGRFSEPQRAYYVTTVLHERVNRYFADFYCARCVVEEMRALHDDKVVNSFAWVVMPDHVHWLFQLGADADLS
jgi:REP element-mobilizing transposase RayT